MNRRQIPCSTQRATARGRQARSAGPLVIWGAATIVLSGLAAAVVLSPPAPALDGEGCVAGRPTNTLVVALDTTDRLISQQPRQVQDAVAAEVRALSPGDRVAVVEIAGETRPEAKPLVSACLPGAATNVERNRFRDRIASPIAARLGELAGRPEAPASPIIETLVALASDRTFNGQGGRLTILAISDGLQNTAHGSVYGAGHAFPSPNGQPMSGVTVDLELLRNPRDAALQPRGVERLVTWLKAAGATVDYTPPRWLALAG